MSRKIPPVLPTFFVLLVGARQGAATSGAPTLRRVAALNGHPALRHRGYQRVTSPSTIKNGQVVTTLSQEPYAGTVHKLGNTYYGARSNEFGYANYELVPKTLAFIHLLGTAD